MNKIQKACVCNSIVSQLKGVLSVRGGLCENGATIFSGHGHWVTIEHHTGDLFSVILHNGCDVRRRTRYSYTTSTASEIVRIATDITSRIEYNNGRVKK